jgi:hypothetical protein
MEKVVKIILGFIIILILILLIYYYIKHKSSKGGGGGAVQLSILCIITPNTLKNQYLVLTENQNIGLTTDKTKATNVTIISDSVILGDTRRYLIQKIQLNNKYVYILPKTQNVDLKDDNLLLSSQAFYLQESDPALTPPIFASLFLDSSNFLCAYFSPSDNYIASALDGGIIFSESLTNSITVQVINV